MPRSRSSNTVAPQMMECVAPSGSTFISGLKSTISNFSTTNWSENAMTDVVTPHGVDRTFNSITHTKSIAAVFADPTCIITYSPPTPTLSTTKYRGVCSMLSTIPQSGLPALNWDEHVSQLADLLDDRISEGSLALVTLCEMGKTIQMVRNPFNLLKPDWRKRMGKLPGSQLVKRASDYWLEWQYGWKAGYADVKAAANTSAKLLAIKPKLERGFSRLSTQKVETSSWASPVYQTGENATTWTDHNAQLVAGRLQSKVMYRASNGSVSRVSRLGCLQDLARVERVSSFLRFLDAWGVGSVSDVIDTLWEIVPYSFVIDWFLDWHAIRQIPKLGRLRSADVRHLGSSVKIYSSYDVEMLAGPQWYVYYRASPWSYKTPTGTSGSFTSKGRANHSVYTRTAGGPGIEGIVSGLLGTGLSSTRGASGLSLIVQRLHR